MATEVILQKELFKVRLNEPLFSEAVNLKALAIAKGIYSGLVPSKVGNTIKIGIGSDPRNLAVVHTELGYSITFVSVDEYTIDFTGHTIYPVWIVLEAVYDTVNETSGRIFATANPQPWHVVICKVLNSNLDIDFDTRTTGLLPGVGVKDVDSNNNDGIDNRYARVDHVHRGVKKIIAGNNITISPTTGVGEVTIASNITISNPTVITGKILGSNFRYGTPLSLTYSAPNKGFVPSSTTTLVDNPCIGVLITDQPANNTDVDVGILGQYNVHNSVFTSTITDAHIGKPMYIASGTSGRFTLIPPSVMQRIGVIKDISGTDVICVINPSLDVIEIV